MNRHGLIAALVVTNVLGVVYNLMAMVPSLPLQSVVSFVFACYRAFLYAIISAFFAKTFGLANLGTLIGIVFSTGAIVNLLEYPAVSLTNEYLGGNLDCVEWLMLVLALLMFPLIDAYRQKRQNEQRPLASERP